MQQHEWITQAQCLHKKPATKDYGLFTPRYIPKRTENAYPHKKLHMNISNINHNSQKLET